MLKIKIFIIAVLILLPNYAINAQQLPETNRQALIVQLTEQIAQLRQQLTQLLVQHQTGPGVPVRLKIPKINVDATISSVGLTPTGEIDTPKGPTTTSWFDLGPRPGENGSAIIDGHFGHWKIGVGSVFDNLNKLSPGDKLFVEDNKGVTITFVVRESRSYDLNAPAPEVFISNDGKPHLNLITCEGVWNETSKTYSKRLVIFADKL